MKKKHRWDLRFLTLAETVSNWSKDPSTKVGAVIVDKNRRVVSLGYNGFPKGVKDTIEKLEDREQKYKHMVHAERNAMLFANKSLKGCTIYTYPFMPCSECAAMIIQSGIKKVVSFDEEDTPSVVRWKKSFEISKKMFEEAGVKIKFCGMRNVIWNRDSDIPPLTPMINTRLFRFAHQLQNGSLYFGDYPE